MFAEITPRLGVRFVAFVNEEPPFFMTPQQGSAVYAEAAGRRGDDVRLMLSLETLGYYSDAPGSQRYPPLFRWFYPERGNFLGLVSDLRSRSQMHRVAALFRQTSDFPLEHVATFQFVPGVSWSDHLPFWQQGYPAIMVTDTAFYRYAHYHLSSDTPDKLTYPAFARATVGLYGALSAYAGVD